MSTSLHELIESYHAARLAFNAADDDRDESGWEVLITAEHAVFDFPCLTLEDVREKALFFINDPGANDALHNDSYDSESTALDRFLRSLLGEVRS
jgi:hypothetical protein